MFYKVWPNEGAHCILLTTDVKATCLVVWLLHSQIALTPKIGHIKKWKLDSSARYGPDKAPVEQAPKSSTPMPNPCKSWQTFGKALAQSRLSLQDFLNKKKKVIHGLACEVGLVVENAFWKSINCSMSDEEKDGVRKFFIRSEISYTAPGSHEENCIWDSKNVIENSIVWSIISQCFWEKHMLFTMIFILSWKVTGLYVFLAASKKCFF